LCYTGLALQERLKKEYKSANKQREGYVDESDDEDDGELTKDGKAMKKLIRNLEQNTAYDSDDERNPYASSVSCHVVVFLSC
jgi:transcription initiation factor TFIIF subunit alpha